VKNDQRSDDPGTGNADGAPAETPSAGPETQTPAVPPGEAILADKSGPLKTVRKLGKKQKKALKDAHRPLDSWERYRALTDALGEALDLVDLGDHKARFALIIAGALNVFLYALGATTDVFDNVPERFRFAMAIFAGLYAVLAIYNLIQAIESLRPRRATPYVHYSADTGGFEEYPLGLRFYEDILSRDMEAYRRAWREVRVGQLNNEVVVQLHALAGINRAKFAALDRLYVGLKLMTVFAVVLLLVGTAFIFHNKGEKLKLKKHALLGVGAEKEEAAASVFGTPQRFDDIGVKEPSGVAFHPRLGHLFVVGDEGKIAELDGDGRLLRSHKLKGDLEDLAVHTPTGNLLVLAEQKGELIWYDPAARQEQKRWQLDQAAVLGQAPGGTANQGFEGIAFREERGRPGGGVFYLVHQKDPTMLVAIAFDPKRPAGSLGGDVVISRWPLNQKEGRAVTYVPSLDRLLVLGDAKDKALVLGMDGSVEGDVSIEGAHPEGMSFDGQGNLWVAEDKGGLLRFGGALAALESHLKGGAPSSPRSEAQAPARHAA